MISDPCHLAAGSTRGIFEIPEHFFVIVGKIQNPAPVHEFDGLQYR
jgi:hypothetical protein